jgi:1,4-dihydroxy-2-naphthoate polyprenyltransferase
MTNGNNNNRARILTSALSLVSPLLIILAWEWAVTTKVLNPFFWPKPSNIVTTLAGLAQTGELWSALGASVMRVTLGFLAGAIPGVMLGLLIGISGVARAILDPIAALINPIPKILIVFFIGILGGLSERTRIISVAVGIFFLILLDVAAAVRRIEPRYFEVARSFGGNRLDEFLTVALPASLPSILNTLKLSLAYALTLLLGVEVFNGATDGIGKLTWEAYQNYQLDRLGAGIIIFALMGWIASLAVDFITPALIPWLPRAVGAADDNPIRRTLGILWRASRPWSFGAAVIPVTLGAILAAYEGKFNLWLFVLTVVGSIAIQAGTNLINDYYDYLKGADSEESLGVGKAIQLGVMTPRQVFIEGIAAFAIGSIIGLYLVSVAGPFILFLGVFSVLAGFFYTAGPAALAYIGLGEITVFVFMGPVMVLGAYYVQAQQISGLAVLASIPIGFLVAAILHANNLRDMESDKAIGKRTLATILGRARANIEYYVLVGGSYLVLVIMVVLRVAPPYTLAALVTFPAAWALMRRVSANTDPAALHPVLRKTAQLHTRFGFLLVAGWVVAIFTNLAATR